MKTFKFDALHRRRLRTDKSLEFDCNSKISIEVNVRGEQMDFKVFNNIVNHYAADESTKVGMKTQQESML